MSAQPALRPDGRAIFLGAVASAARPRQRVTVSQWADTHRVLSSKASNEPGQWKTSRTPFAREPMDCLSVMSPIQKVVMRFPTQLVKTEVGLNWIGYVMHHAPAPMLVVVPTLEVRKRWVRQRVDPMLIETKALAQLFDARSKRDAGNSEDMKDFPGGMLIIGGANSPASLAAMPIKYFIADEVDRFPWQVGKGDKAEGDPLGLVRERLKSFGRRRKELLLSTPVMKGASRIDEEFESTDQRYYNVPCPHCDALLVLKWANLHWNNAVTEARYVCEHCGAEIAEHHKPAMLADGRWVPAVANFLLPWRGYALNALYSPIGLGFTWVELARMWVDAQKDATKVKLKRFVNTSLAEAWEDRSRAVKATTLKERAEPYRLREIPPGCLLLTCGVDVQADRIALQVVGWGREQACWIVDWVELPGDPVRMIAQAMAESPGGALYDYLVQPFANRYGKEMRIEATAIDTGHHTHDVYALVRAHGPGGRSAGRLRRLIAIKGSSIPSRPILGGRPQAQDVNWRGRLIKSGVKLWTVGTDTAKHALVARLTGDSTRLAEAEDDPNAPAPDLTIHFSRDLPVEYYEQLTAEVFDPEHNKWVKRRGRRNEGLDTWVYACAASQHPELRVHAKRASDWLRLEQMLEPASPNGTATLVPTNAAAPTAPPQPVKQASLPAQPRQPDDPWLR